MTDSSAQIAHMRQFILHEVFNRQSPKNETSPMIHVQAEEKAEEVACKAVQDYMMQKMAMVEEGKGKVVGELGDVSASLTS